MNGWKFRELLRGGALLADGGMGTSLVAAGIPVGTCFDALNLDAPDLVEGVHRDFVGAGSALVVTNTFGANRFKLERLGMAERTAELNRAGAGIARRSGALVAGSVGPLGVRLAPYGRVPAADARAAFAEQIEALVLGGVDVITIETQSDLSEMEQALAAAREVGDVAVMVCATFARDDRTLLGSTPEHVAEVLTELGADAIGVNCGQGPSQALRIARAMRSRSGDTPIVARPNAGGPREVAGRLLYPATPEYFAEYALALREDGVGLVGGCCGTTPDHIRAMASALAAPADASSRAAVAGEEDARAGDTGLDGPESPTGLGRKLAAGEFVVAVEMDPPRGFSAAKMLAGSQTLAEAGADVIDVADSPMARMRMSPWAACSLIQEHGIETVLHFPTRGRNLLRLQGDLLAVHALGIRNVFVCLGDPVSIGDYPGATDNVDVVPTALMRLVTRGFNEGRDRSGASIGEATAFLAGCAVSPNADDLDAEATLLNKKINAGVAFALSQPVYAPEPLVALRAAYERLFGELSLPILAGVLPLASARHAEYLHNEVPGISIPVDVRERMHAAGEGAEREGLDMATELVASLREHAAGIYLMPPFERFDIAAEVVEAAKAPVSR